MSLKGTASGSDIRATLIRQAFQLEYMTLAWMAVEVFVAVCAGVAARSLTLTAF